jgi:outer membrane protein
MLRVTTDSQAGQVTLRLEGKLSGPWVEEFKRSWTLTKGIYPDHVLIVNLSGLTFVDAAGKEFLRSIDREGARLEGAGLFASSLVEDIKVESRKAGAKSKNAGLGGLRSLALLVVAAIACLSTARAQDKPPLRLTLRDAVQLALKQNPQVQIANLNAAQSSEDRAIARSALLPQAGIEVMDKAQRFNLEAFIGSRFPNTPQHAGPFQTFQAGPVFSMPVFDLTLWRRLQVSRHGAAAAQAREQSIREEIVLLVVSQYLGGLRAAADVRAAQSRVALAQALHDQAADLQQHGVSTGLDTLRANVQLQNEKQRLIVAETQLKTSLYGLARLLSLDPRQPLELSDAMSFFETPEAEASQNLEQAYATRPEIKAIAAREQALLAQKKAASASRLPRLMFNGTWGYQGLSLPTAIPAYVYQATVEMPLFTGGRIRAEVTKADLELKKVAQEKEEQKNQVALEVRTALAQLQAARHEVEVANLGVKLAEEEVSQARDRFQAGVANNIEVVSAQDAFARANDNQIAALYRYNQARADLAHSIGQIEALYTK